jgi:beta-glucosidase
VTAADPEENRRSIQEATAVAAQADVVVLAIGDNEQTSREAWATNHLGDRPSLDLAGEQDELFDAVAATGKPVVVLLFSGRQRRSGASPSGGRDYSGILGQETGSAVANVLFGDVTQAASCHHDPRSGARARVLQLPQALRAAGVLFDSVAPLFPSGSAQPDVCLRTPQARERASTVARGRCGTPPRRRRVVQHGPHSGRGPAGKSHRSTSADLSQQREQAA